MHDRVTTMLLLAGALVFSTSPTVSGQGASSGGASRESNGALPKDIYPDSLSRLPSIKREDLNEQAKKAYDAAAASSPTGRPEGVAAIRLHRSGVDVRWDSPVGRRLCWRRGAGS